MRYVVLLLTLVFFVTASAAQAATIAIPDGSILVMPDGIRCYVPDGCVLVTPDLPIVTLPLT